MKALRLVFMGSPDFAVPSLRALARYHQVLSVVTQPDRAQGRGQRLARPPVKIAAEELGLPILQPVTLRPVREHLAMLGADAFVVVAYGKILSPKMLAIPPLGCINVHASLLPQYRGAAPLQWAILRGEKRTGLTIMKMDKGMDTGPVLLQQAVELSSDETGGSLHDRLAPLGAELLLQALAGCAEGNLCPVPQIEQGVSTAPLLSKGDGLVWFSSSAAEVDCWIRGMDPWPGAFTLLGEEHVKLFSSRAIPGQSGRPGEVLAADMRGLLVACAKDAVLIRELQLPGRRRMPAAALLSGRPIPLGTVLGRSET
jgi:methionyl-tRNA formyltransferase